MYIVRLSQVFVVSKRLRHKNSEKTLQNALWSVTDWTKTENLGFNASKAVQIVARH